MNYIIIDLEWNQSNTGEEPEVNEIPFEAPGGRLVELLADSALEGHGEHVEHRCVGVPPLGGTPAGAGYFVRMTFAADHAHIVGGGEGPDRGEGHGEVRTAVEVLSGGMGAHRYHYLRCIPLAGPGCVHGIGGSVGIICAENQNWLREKPCVRFEVLRHNQDFGLRRQR